MMIILETALNKIQRQEAILKTAELLNSTQDTSYILQALLNQALKYIKGGDAGIIFLYNKKNGLLEVRSYVGFDQEVEAVTLKPNESITGISFAKKEPILYSTAQQLKTATATMGKANRKLIKNTFEKLFPKVYSSIACPLLFNNTCFGVIVVDNFTKDTPLTQEDLDFLKAISIQATIAVNNALNYEKELENNIALQYSTNLHNKFTSMVLKSCTLQDVITTLSQLLDKDIIGIDTFYNIKNFVLKKSLSYKSIASFCTQISQKLDPENPTTFIIPNSEYSLFLYPIIVSKIPLGWLGIISSQPLDSKIENITIERGITTLALQLLKDREIQEIEQKLKGDFLENLIENQDKEYLTKYCHHYGYNINKEHQIIILELKPSSSTQFNNYDMEFINCQKKLYEHLSRSFITYFPNTIIMVKGYNLIFVLELNKTTKSHLSKKTIERLLNSDQTKLIILNKIERCSVGISNPFQDISLFKDAYLKALQALKIGKNIHERNFIEFYDELEIKKILLNNPPEILADFVEKTLGELLNYTKNSRKEFLNTLILYIKSNRNWSYTKDKLHIHGNTLSYRLKRIEEILKLDLNNYNHILKIQLALEILEIS
jgi:sugar diacid utilization regulator